MGSRVNRGWNIFVTLLGTNSENRYNIRMGANLLHYLHLLDQIINFLLSAVLLKQYFVKLGSCIGQLIKDRQQAPNYLQQRSSLDKYLSIDYCSKVAILNDPGAVSQAMDRVNKMIQLNFKINDGAMVAEYKTIK